MAKQRADEFFPCPHCGANVSVTAKHCRQCGADDDVGWSEANSYEDEPYEDDFDYDEFVRREFPGEGPPQSKNVWVIAVIVLVCLAMLASLFS